MINYVEFASADPQTMRDFFEATLGWSFEWSVPTMSPFTALG